MNFDQLKFKIEQATKQAFTEIYQQHAAEGIYAFALYSDENAMTVCPATNCLTALTSIDPEDLDYYRFEPAEWAYEMQGADLIFNQISTELRNTVSQYLSQPEKLVQFRDQLYRCCIEVLLKLKQEHFFSQLTQQDIFLLFTVSDYEFEMSRIQEIVTQLNDSHYATEYLTWMKTWGN